MNSINKWDPDAKTWQREADMHQHRSKHAVTVVRCDSVLQTCSWQCFRKVQISELFNCPNSIRYLSKTRWLTGIFVVFSFILFLTLSDLLWVTPPSATLVQKSVFSQSSYPCPFNICKCWDTTDFSWSLWLQFWHQRCEGKTALCEVLKGSKLDLVQFGPFIC